MPNIQNGSAKGKKKNKEEDSDDNKNRPKRDAARKAESFLQAQKCLLVNKERSDIQRALKASLKDVHNHTFSSSDPEKTNKSNSVKDDDNDSEHKPKRLAAKKAEAFLHVQTSILHNTELADIKKAMKESLIEAEQKAEYERKVEEFINDSVASANAFFVEKRKPEEKTSTPEKKRVKKSSPETQHQYFRSKEKELEKVCEAVVNPQCKTPRKAKIPAQRKFAQGSVNNTPTSSPTRSRSKNESRSPELFSFHRPTAEDFLTWICFWKWKGRKLLPPHLDLFALNGISSESKDLSETDS